jgi:2-keto-4-pentenoate hydratase/2-oxohepta-3-ene-1,7-dioic acid hydratase in catechol pathway
MKLVLFRNSGAGDLTPGLLTDRGVVDISSAVRIGHTPQDTMQNIINDFDSLRPALEQLQSDGAAVPLDSVKLGPPLPRPGKIVNCIANYWEHAQREPRDLNVFLKSSDAVVGPGDTVRLPNFTTPWAFMHEAELGLVFKGPSKDISQENWRDAIFGYTCFMDMTARGEGRVTWKKGSWIGKSFDTFAPLGPCIVTADEIPEPNDLHVQFWSKAPAGAPDDSGGDPRGQLRHNYNTDDMEHRVPELVWFVTQFMTMNSGDVMACGTNHEGLGFIQDGETVTMMIHGIGEMSVTIEDPLKRTWERGVYMGEDSTHHAAVKRHRPEVVLKPSDASV